MTTPSVPSTPPNPIRRISGAFRQSPISYREHSKPTILSLHQVKKQLYILALLVGAVWLSFGTKSSSELSSVANASVTMDDKAIKSESSTPYLRGDAVGGSPPSKSASATLNIKGSEQQQTITFDATTSNPFDKEYDNCIIGAGLSGSVIAENYATKFGQTSLILEKRDHIGGNCYDYIDEETGIRVSLYGAHLFHTRHERVWEYVQQFTEWVPYEHEVLGKVNGKIVPIPVTIDSVNKLFDLNIQTSEEMDEWMKNERVQFTDDEGNPREPVNSEEVALSTVGQRLYDLIFKPYTKKQWDKYPAELGPEVLSRIPVRNNRDGRYFNDPHQALPKDGYTGIFEKMLDSDKITVLTNTDYFEVSSCIMYNAILLYQMT